MTKQKSTSAFQTIEEAKAQCRRAKGKQEYAVAERWLKKFKFWYSPTGKRYKAPASAIAIYSYIAGLNEQGKECYANQDTLGEIGSVEPRQVRNIIKMLEDVGVVHVDRRKGQTSICTALPFTDAHVIPPDQLPATPESDVVQQQPEPATAEELNAPDLDDIPFACDEPDYATAEPESASLREMITDDVTIDALCDLLSKPDSLQQHNRGDTFIDFARRVLRLKRKILPHKLEKGLEERYASRHPAYYKPRFDDFDIPF